MFQQMLLQTKNTRRINKTKNNLETAKTTVRQLKKILSQKQRRHRNKIDALKREHLHEVGKLKTEVTHNQTKLKERIHHLENILNIMKKERENTLQTKEGRTCTVMKLDRYLL